MGEIAKLRQKSDKIWFDINLIWYNMKMTILGKILVKFRYQDYKKFCFPNVNSHNWRHCFMIILYTKYRFHLVFHTESRFCTNLIKKYSVLYCFWVQNYWFYIILSTKIEYKLRTETCNNIISRYFEKILFCTVLYQIVLFLYHHSWLER